MKWCIASRLPVIVLAVCLNGAALCDAGDGYVSHAYAQTPYPGAGYPGARPHAPNHATMASPLAGGPAAAMGGQFVDVHGRPIVMPASYHAPHHGPAMHPGAHPAMCDPYGGDPMAVDFGGYGPDQVGPHYFDVSFGAVFLQTDRVFDGVGPLASIGAGAAAPRILDPSNSLDDYSAGWEVALRYDLGPLSLFEATYMGLYDIGFRDTVRSVDVAPGGQDFQLFTVFSNFGVPVPIDGVDDGSVYSLRYQSDFQSVELSYRRYWLANNTRVTGTYLLGFRHLRMTEDLNWDIQALMGNSALFWSTENDLLGFQVGADGWYAIRQGLRIGTEGKAGVYNNRFRFGASGDFPAGIGAPDDFVAQADGNQVAFAAETGIQIVADILPSWSLKGGYRAFYLNNLVTVGGNIDTAGFVPDVLNSQSSALYHGFNGGLEYVW